MSDTIIDCEITEDFDGEQAVNKTFNIIVNAKRPMPAHFTSNGDRLQSFCIDFDDMTADEEYNMASQSYNSLENYTEKIDDMALRGVRVYLGENIMIGSFILSRLGHPEFVEKLFNKIVDYHQKLVKKDKEMNLGQSLKDPRYIRYLNFCKMFGVKTALHCNNYSKKYMSKSLRYFLFGMAIVALIVILTFTIKFLVRKHQENQSYKLMSCLNICDDARLTSTQESICKVECIKKYE